MWIEQITPGTIKYAFLQYAKSQRIKHVYEKMSKLLKIIENY